jgi:hypothetical protein
MFQKYKNLEAGIDGTKFLLISYPIPPNYRKLLDSMNRLKSKMKKSIERTQ